MSIDKLTNLNNKISGKDSDEICLEPTSLINLKVVTNASVIVFAMLDSESFNDLLDIK